MTRALVYTRFSKDEDDETATARQEKICRAFCAARDWDVAGVQTDRISAFSGKDRPGWLAVEAAVRERAVDAVVVYSISRAARNTVRLLTFAELCRENEVAFESATEPIGGDFGPVLLALLGALAELESQTKRRRLLDKSAENAANGTWHGKEPFGFRIVRRGGHATLEIREKEADAIRGAARDVLNGKSIRQVCREWNEAGLRTRTGKQFTPARVRDVLEAPRNAALRLHRGEVVGRAGWEPILDRRTVEELAALFRGRAVRDRGEAYPLTGVLFCSEDGTALGGRPSHGKREYICHRTGSVHSRIRAEELEAWLVEQCETRAVSARDVLDPREVAAELLEERDAVDEKIRAWNRNAAAAGLSVGEIVDGRRDLVVERERIEAEIEVQAAPAAVSWQSLYGVPGNTGELFRSRLQRVVVKPRDRKRPTSEVAYRVEPVWREAVTKR